MYGQYGKVFQNNLVFLDPNRRPVCTFEMVAINILYRMPTLKILLIHKSSYYIARDGHVQPILMKSEVFLIFKSYPPISTLEIPKIVSKNCLVASSGQKLLTKSQIQKFEF